MCHSRRPCSERIRILVHDATSNSHAVFHFDYTLLIVQRVHGSHKKGGKLSELPPFVLLLNGPYAYALVGSQVQIRFRSPCVLLTRATEGQNLLLRT